MAKTNYIGITRVLAIAGCTDFSFVNEEALWRGSQVHRIMELRLLGKLDRKTVPLALRGYLEAIDKFSRETSFIPTYVEKYVQSKHVGIRGRIDCAGILRGILTVVDFKTSPIQPAVKLQLCLGGHLLDPLHWWNRCAVQLKPDGNYSLYPRHKMELKMWGSDLVTALAAARIAQWKIKEGMV